MFWIGMEYMALGKLLISWTKFSLGSSNLGALRICTVIRSTGFNGSEIETRLALFKDGDPVDLTLNR